MYYNDNSIRRIGVKGKQMGIAPSEDIYNSIKRNAGISKRTATAYIEELETNNNIDVVMYSAVISKADDMAVANGFPTRLKDAALNIRNNCDSGSELYDIWHEFIQRRENDILMKNLSDAIKHLDNYHTQMESF